MNIIGKVILTATALAVSAPVMASGSGGGGGGGFGGGGFSRVQRDPAQVDFSRGKSYFKKYVTCNKCSHSGGVKDARTAQTIAQQVRSGDIAVKSKHKRQLLYYISRRYGIRA